MPFLNISYSFLLYEDANNPKNPNIRVPDITRNVEGVNVSFDRSERVTINPNEIKDITVTSRALGLDATTEITFDNYISSEDNIRITYTGTGTAPNFVTNRNIGGDATTEVTITRVSNNVARISVTGGTAWTLGSVQPNDFIRFEKTDDAFTSPFSANNQGKRWLVNAVGATSIDFIDNGAISLDAAIVLGADFAKALKVVSQGPVRIGDTVEVSGAGINPSNHGKFAVQDVSDDYIEIVNALAQEETLVLSTNMIVVYEYLIGFLHMRATGSLKLRFGNQTEFVAVERIGAESLYMASVCTYQIQARNDTKLPITASIQTAMVSG